MTPSRLAHSARRVTSSARCNRIVIAPAYRVFPQLRVVDIAAVMGSLLPEYYILIGDRTATRG